MSFLKKVLKSIIGEKGFVFLRDSLRYTQNLKKLMAEYYRDAKLYHDHSVAFKKNTFQQLEALITLRYHSIEKGLLHKKLKFQFGKAIVEELIKLLKSPILETCPKNKNIESAYLALYNYYQVHLEHAVDISSFFPEEEYHRVLSKMNKKGGSVKILSREAYFSNSSANFSDFSNSRASVRHFTGEYIPLETINSAIELAKNTPSVCNRQPNKVYLISKKDLLKDIFELQGGFKGYDKNLVQALAVTTDRSFFYNVSERNQMYIDGGLFVMNLLYCLHHYNIAACPAHWAHPKAVNKKANKLLGLKESQQIICMIPIGVAQEEFSVALSLRRDLTEYLEIID